jgi:hypothetical protein
MGSLWRLATWGAAAAASLIIAVIAGYSEAGSQRLMATRASPSPAQATPNDARLAAHERELDAETRRLADAVRTLTADRDRLAARVGLLERNLEDVTGSVKRQAAISDALPGAASPPPVAPIPPSAPTTAVAAKDAATAPVMPASPKEAVAPPVPDRLPGMPVRPAIPVAAEPPAVTPEQAAPATAVNDDSNSEPVANKTEFGADIGGAASFEGVRALWTSARSRNAALFEGLHPVVAARENNRTKAVELRLIVGPFTTAEAAGHLCSILTGTRRYCLPVAFEGQRLAQADGAAERKPASPQKSAPVSATRPAWPFR